MKLHHHRRFTANHTWHLDINGRALFIKANPSHSEARAEAAGHARLTDHYPVPALRARLPLPGWTLLIYDRWPGVGPDTGLLLDLIAQADQTGGLAALDGCLDDVIGHYRNVIESTAHLVHPEETVGKLYTERAAHGGRIDAYYGNDRQWKFPGPENLRGIRPSELADLQLNVNGTTRRFDFAAILRDLRRHFADPEPVWAAFTQGDPTDFNLGWSRENGPVWFDYDTAGLNAIAGEFANFLLYQRLHGPRLVPRYNPGAFADHRLAHGHTALADQEIQVRTGANGVSIDHHYSPSQARRHAMTRYLQELVLPVAAKLGIGDLMAWLRPYLLMRLLAVYDLTDFQPVDAALCLALTVDTLDSDADLHRLLTLEPADEKAN